jgi:hypothetical protein
MTEKLNGCSIDVDTFTVLVCGMPLLKDLLTPFKAQIQHDAMVAFNQIALAIVKIHGPAFGLDPENPPEPKRWSLGTGSKEESDYMMSFLPVKELQRSEVVSYQTAREIKPLAGF